jgi:hypothetical protein
VSTAEVLKEGMPGNDHPGRAVGAQPTHRSQPVFEVAVIGLDRIVGVTLDVMPRRGNEFIE